MIELGENIKKYRLKKDMTQTQLACVFNVSEQAVSRWENGNTYPDISLLPGMADYFGISIDELMGMESYKDERKIEQIIATVKENERKGLIRENVMILQKAAVKYPKNYVILSYLVGQLVFEDCENEAENTSNREKAVEIADRILNECTDRNIWNYTINEKIIALTYLGRTEEAIKIANEQPNIWETRECRLSNLYSGDELVSCCKSNIKQYAGLMYWTILRLADLDFLNDRFSISERIDISKKALDILELVYEGNYGIANRNVAQMNRFIAAMYALEENTAATLEHLEKAAEYAIKYETMPETVTHTSVLLSGSEDKRSTVTKNFTGNECTELYERLSQERYNFVRENERFKAVENTLLKYI